MALTASAAQQTVASVQGALSIIASLQLTGYKYPEQSCVFDGSCYDYIVVGAGTAGCIVASRLAEDNKTSVLLIEAGGDPRLEGNLPYLMLYVKGSESSWNYTIQDPGVSQESHKPTNDDLGIGRSLGGSSASSYLIYTSGNKYDYNNWAKITNDTTWKWKNVLKYLKKSQRLEDQALLSTDEEFYGEDGNIGLTVLRDAGTIRSEPYLKAFSETGSKIVSSVNGNITLGYTNAIYTISNGTRQETASTYLTPKKPNLHVLKNAVVKRIIFDCYKNAIGVEVVTCNNRFVIVKARREVILSAGIVNSPKILMLSGIGRREQLCKHKIHTISNLPVGEGLQDHLGVTMVFNMTKKVVPFRPFNIYSYPAALLVGYAALNKSEDYPDYQSFNYISFTTYLINYCTFTYYYSDTICNNLFSTNVNTQMMFSIVNKQKYKSRGRILLNSGDFRDDPLIYTGYFEEEEDLDDYARIVQDYANILDTETMKELGGKFQDPKLPKCGEYNRDNLEYWKCYVQYMITSQRQYSSTCAMGSVVDSRLRVYGVRRLRVVDASIMPNPTAGGTLGSTIMIGEKAADMIKEDHLKRE